jgi:DNA-binding transcriptional MerR regulator
MTTTTATSRGLRVGELATAPSVTADTVRFYERVGLMPPPQRTPAGYRVYDMTALDRLRFIQGSQRFGLRLRQIRDLLAVRDTGVCPCEPAGQFLQARLEELDAEMTRLGALRTELVAMVDALPSPSCPDPVPGTWCPPEGGDER